MIQPAPTSTLFPYTTLFRSMHPFKMEVQHVDFQRVSADEKIHIKVPLHFVNAEKSPAIKEQGGLITHVLSEDRKSTRLNSSHQIISYAVFCLKKKKYINY